MQIIFMKLINVYGFAKPQHINLLQNCHAHAEGLQKKIAPCQKYCGSTLPYRKCSKFLESNQN